MQDNTMSLQPEEAAEEEEVVDGPLFIDLSKIDDKGRFPAFCGKCMIIGNITLDHARECPLSKKRCNKSCKDNNDDPLSLWICRCCVYRPGLAESYRPHLVPVQACPPSSYYDPTSPPSSYYYPTSNYYPTSELSANAMAQQPGALLAGGSNKGPYSDVMNEAENAKKKAREF